MLPAINAQRAAGIGRCFLGNLNLDQLIGGADVIRGAGDILMIGIIDLCQKIG